MYYERGGKTLQKRRERKRKRRLMTEKSSNGNENENDDTLFPTIIKAKTFGRSITTGNIYQTSQYNDMVIGTSARQ